MSAQDSVESRAQPQQMQLDPSKVNDKTNLNIDFTKRASDRGYRIVDNKGKGNCMFYALSDQLETVLRSKIEHDELRKALVQYLRVNPTLPNGSHLPELYSGDQSWADYLTNMEQDGFWGDHVILCAAANCYKTCIRVVSCVHEDTIIESQYRRTLVLGHIPELHYVSLHPKQGNIASVELKMNNDTDPSGERRKEISKILLSEATASDAEDEREESRDFFIADNYSSDEDEQVEEEVQANPNKPCYYPSQIEMAAILKKRIDAIMSHYHNISKLREVFNDVEFVVYTARYRMLSGQTAKRIYHPDAGVIPKKELESHAGDGKKRMFMYVRSTDTDTNFDELKRDVQQKPRTLFVIVADECHWGITKDKGRKPSAHNLFINEWCKEKPPKNVIVLQISATPFNLLTQNSRLAEVQCIIQKEDVSIIRKQYRAGDLVLAQEPELKQGRNTSKELELHVVHWSEVELKNFERGMRMKLKSSLKIKGSSYLYLQVSTEGNLVVTSVPEEATEFIIQGSHGIVTFKVERAGRLLTVTPDSYGQLEAKSDPPMPTKFEVKMDFGVGVVAFRSCDRQDHYISVDENEYVSLQAAKIELKCGVSIMKPMHKLAKVSFQFYTDQSAPMEVKTVGKQYMSLNYYLSTIDSPRRKDQKIREDETFQSIVDKAKREKKVSQSDSTSFPIDALLCADYCYHIVLSSVFNSDDKICKALTFEGKESPTTEFHRLLAVYKMKLKVKGVERYIHPEAFELIQRNIYDRVTKQFEAHLKNVEKLQKQTAPDCTEMQTSKEQLAISIVECIMHLPPQKFEQLKHNTPLFQDIKQQLQANGCKEMVRIWHNLVQKHETSSLVEDLIQSGKGHLGKMKIVRAKTQKTADQFYYTVRLARELSGLKEHFEVIRDYGGIQIENQLMKPSSPFFKKVQPEVCTYKFDCCCSKLELQPRLKTCSNCHHVHKSITQYEDLENLACILILVGKGRMGDTFPQSFDCLDLRLSYDSSQEFKEDSAVYLSSLIQELGRICRYANVSSSVIPYVLIGRQLFKKLQTSLETSPSINVTSCTNPDRYMTKTSKKKDTQSSPLRWLDYVAHKDSYDYGNEQKHCNRILLQAEPQIGKTGTYLCLIRDLRLDILGKEGVMLASPAAFDEGNFYQRRESNYPDESILRERDERENWQFPYWKTIETSPSLHEKPVGTGKYSIGECVYTHDTEESPFILLKEGRTPIETGREKLRTEDCSNGLRAWRWSHFEECVDCGRLLQGRESIEENVKVDIDGIRVTVRCSLPSNCPSFTQLQEKLASAKSQEDSLTLPYWIFHPSHRSDPRKCTLNYHHVMKEGDSVANYVQVVIVRKEKFEAYRSTWGKVLVILQLPESLPNCDLAPDEGGIGYARLFIQKIAFSLELEYVFMIDDNVAMMSEAEFPTDDMSGKERKVLRDDNGVMKMARCTFLKPLTSLQKIAQGRETPPIVDEEYEPHPLKDDFEAQGFPLYTYSGPAKLFRDKQHGSYGILGLMRSIPRAVRPFAKTQVYAAVLLNVKSTVEKGVFYRPWPCWEDLRFNDDCDKAGLWVVKCNRYSFFKVQYKDWIMKLVPRQVFRWDEECSIVERRVESDLSEAAEEEIILKYLCSLTNTSGREKSFKGRIGYDRIVEEERRKSPLNIVDKVDACTVTEEAFAKGVSLLVLSYSAGNRSMENLILLDSHFRRTKEKIVFVSSVEEVKKKWPQLTIYTIPTENGICFSQEMSDRNARFSILSAADPRRCRLRWILIEASFSQNDDNSEVETGTSNIETSERNPEETRNLLTLVEGTLSNLQITSIAAKGEKTDVDTHMDGTNGVTRIIVELWREYRETQLQFEEKCRRGLTIDEIKNKLQPHSDELGERDERGYNALLKACSLPANSPLVMQYLITSQKVDLNSQLPSDFDVNHPAHNELVPGMSSLSVAIRKENVESVPMFMTVRSSEIMVQSSDDDGNTALHHSVISVAKTAFDTIFPLFKPRKWRDMRNKEKKNALDMCIEKQKELRGQKEVKETTLKKIDDMRQEMEKDPA
ncbi:uncharacterized protein LOC111318964 [Stylophora pistillata]|uniref:OTU domain-containing protein n=1 Tax=Stylophora pistillata TaxID=50429 RepID=A0A2B4R2Z1_STYPI|nr:uncharacterized protein LOC111318964 [Stylophora pistillata]XP_022777547.1 uncharacterized protein LOC111318964 [Stylophora pistillata]PFX11991.1 OTU domain-containing protein [Stylophora pistillata]